LNCAANPWFVADTLAANGGSAEKVVGLRIVAQIVLQAELRSPNC